MIKNDDLTEKIIGVCYRVHSELGPGFSEKIYHNALKIALKKEGLKFASERGFEVRFQKISVGQFRIDLLIEDRVIVEIKAIDGILPKVFEAQAISYLKASGLKTALLVNFGSRSCQVRRLMS